MAKLPNLQAIRETVRGNIVASNLAKQSNNSTILHNGLNVVPDSEMWRVVQWLENDLLPKVLLHRGKDSHEYLNYVSVRDSVIWALYIAGQYENLLAKNQRDLQLLGYYVEKNQFYERELSKYTAIEQLITDETAVQYRQAIIAKALNILNQKK